MKLTPQASLLHWYEINGRHDLPWRNTRDPYPIWISEIMLQQTQVKTVLERFYFPFLERFPILLDLADAELDDVLKMWEGLGYYTRARNLHSAAKQCNGILPKTASELLELPGIGRSTAHAIAAFAYREPLPILDANVKRILHRYFSIPQRDEKLLWKAAYELFDPYYPYEYNQAMMDLGSSVCLPKRPLCSLCPFQNFCSGKNAPTDYPEAKSKTIKPVRHRSIIVHQRDGYYALAQRKGRFLSGLWGFYETLDDPSNSMEPIGSVIQHYSHFTLEANAYLCDEECIEEEFEWFTLDEINMLSLSRADHKVISLLYHHLDKKNGNQPS